MAAPEQKPRAKYVKYSKRVAVELCARVADGQSVKSICRTVAGMPSATTVFRWQDSIPEFAEMLDAAHRIMAHAIGSEIIELADAAAPTFTDADGTVRCDHAAVNLRRLQVDTRKWYLAKVLPKVWGDKLEVSGPNGTPLMPPSADPMEVARKVAFLLNAADRAMAEQPPPPAQPLALPAPDPRGLVIGRFDDRGHPMPGAFQ